MKKIERDGLAERVLHITAAISLGIGVAAGALAIDAHNDAIYAEATADAYDNSQSAAYQSYDRIYANQMHLISATEEDDRNLNMMYAFEFLGIAALTGGTSIYLYNSRRDMQEPVTNIPAQTVVE